MYLRGSATWFVRTDVNPTWTEYTAPVTQSWRYVQVISSTSPRERDMTNIYRFGPCPGGFKWNIHHRIALELGLSVAVDEAADGATVVRTSQPLTAEQEGAIAALMAQSPQFPPPPGPDRTVFKIVDIVDGLPALSAKLGMPLELYFSESARGSGKVDTVELHVRRATSPEERSAVMQAYAASIREA